MQTIQVHSSHSSLGVVILVLSVGVYVEVGHPASAHGRVKKHHMELDRNVGGIPPFPHLVVGLFVRVFLHHRWPPVYMNKATNWMYVCMYMYVHVCTC